MIILTNKIPHGEVLGNSGNTGKELEGSKDKVTLDAPWTCTGTQRVMRNGLNKRPVPESEKSEYMGILLHVFLIGKLCLRTEDEMSEENAF